MLDPFVPVLYPPHPLTSGDHNLVPWYDIDGQVTLVPATYLPPTTPPYYAVTITLLIVTFALWIVSSTAGRDPLFGLPKVLYNFGVVRYFVVDQWQIGRLFTAVFLHANFLHWAENAIFLLFLGRVLEPTFGGPRMFAIFLLGGMAGTTMTSTQVYSLMIGVGMSGGIYALIGAHIAHLYNNRATIQNFDRRIMRNLSLVGMLAVLNLGYLLIGRTQIGGLGLSVDVVAHISGFAAGFLLTRLFGPVLVFRARRTLEQGRVVIDATDARPFTFQSAMRMTLLIGTFIAVVMLVLHF